ncbi:MAG: hypothetical protein ACLP9L_23390, partial [Thermoguttaceae bacterium]
RLGRAAAAENAKYAGTPVLVVDPSLQPGQARRGREAQCARSSRRLVTQHNRGGQHRSFGDVRCPLD